MLILILSVSDLKKQQHFIAFVNAVYFSLKSETKVQSLFLSSLSPTLPDGYVLVELWGASHFSYMSFPRSSILA